MPADRLHHDEDRAHGQDRQIGAVRELADQHHHQHHSGQDDTDGVDQT